MPELEKLRPQDIDDAFVDALYYGNANKNLGRAEPGEVVAGGYASRVIPPDQFDAVEGGKT